MGPTISLLPTPWAWCRCATISLKKMQKTWGLGMDAWVVGWMPGIQQAPHRAYFPGFPRRGPLCCSLPLMLTLLLVPSLLPRVHSQHPAAAFSILAQPSSKGWGKKKHLACVIISLKVLILAGCLPAPPLHIPELVHEQELGHCLGALPGSAWLPPALPCWLPGAQSTTGEMQ